MSRALAWETSPKVTPLVDERSQSLEELGPNDRDNNIRQYVREQTLYQYENNPRHPHLQNTVTKEDLQMVASQVRLSANPVISGCVHQAMIA